MEISIPFELAPEQKTNNGRKHCFFKKLFLHLGLKNQRMYCFPMFSITFGVSL
jgi:hypothetical protein